MDSRAGLMAALEKAALLRIMVRNRLTNSCLELAKFIINTGSHIGKPQLALGREGYGNSQEKEI